MSARDELHDLLERTFDDVGIVYDAVTDAILAAGYRKPRTITTAEELDGLPAGSVVLDGDVCVRRNDGYWKVSDLAGVYASNALALPAPVLYEPEPTQ